MKNAGPIVFFSLLALFLIGKLGLWIYSMTSPDAYFNVERFKQIGGAVAGISVLIVLTVFAVLSSRKR